MILKSFYFDLDRMEYPNDYGYDLLLKSRFYCNYIERMALKPLKWKTPSFNRIVIGFTNRPANLFYINSSQVLHISAPFNQLEYENAKTGNIAEYFISCTENIVPEIRKKGIDLPVEEISRVNNQFRTEQYVNKWLFKKTVNKVLALEAFLYCALTESKFELVLTVNKGKQVVLQKLYLHPTLTRFFIIISLGKLFLPKKC